MAQDHVGISQLGQIQLGKPRPLSNKIQEISNKIQETNKIQDQDGARVPFPACSERALGSPPDPSTPSESPDLTPQGDASGGGNRGRAHGPKGVRAPSDDAPALDAVSPTAVAKPDAPRRFSPEARALAARLKARLQDRGVTVFPRDWHLKGMASATLLLRQLTVQEIEALMDWALAHPFWGPKTTDMRRLVALAAEWQQARRHPVAVPQASHAPQVLTVVDRNMALLRRLYAETVTQEGRKHDASG
jgi:hypothetical protein